MLDLSNDIINYINDKLNHTTKSMCLDFIDGHSMKDIADKNNISAKKAKRIIQQALKPISEELKGQGTTQRKTQSLLPRK